MKKPVAIIFNDVHIKLENEEAVVLSVEHMLEYAKSKKIKNLIFAGDMFERRAFLRLSEMKTLEIILDKISAGGFLLDAIPGNHSKTRYESEDSYLDIYKYFPNVTIHKTLSKKVINGVDFTFLPYFSDDRLLNFIKKAEGGEVLISHLEMDGSANLGKISIKKTFPKRLFKKWKKVYLGHFHNNFEITKDIAHLPSLRQNNFGEDNNKGFSVLYDDLSYEIIHGKFREHIKFEIDVDKTDLSEIKRLISKYKGSSDIVRFEFFGQESKLKALDKNLFEGTGIDVKKKYSEENIFKTQKEIKFLKKHDKDSVEEAFVRFCKEKNLDYDSGEQYLKEFLKNKN